MSKLHLDFETRSAASLRQVGVHRYADHPTTEIILMGWAFDDEPVAVWRQGEPFPDRVRDHVRSGGELWSWNAEFERTLWRVVGARRYGWPFPDDGQYVCVMAMASAMSLPRHLEDAARVLKLAHQKDAEGHALMLRMCRPRRLEADGTPVWWTDPEKMDRLAAYCARDVEAEREMARYLRPLSAAEREIYLLDQRVNDRGVPFDLDLVRAMAVLARQEIDVQNSRLAHATEGEVEVVTKTAALRDWLASRGVETESVDKAAVRDLIARSDLPDDVALALAARQEASKSSLAKLKAIADVTGDDGRARGMLLYHGASTGRWSGRLIQVHNFKRPEIRDVERYVPAVLDGTLPDVLEGERAAGGSPPSALTVLTSMMRSTIAAPEGRELVTGDYSAVEARGVAWLAGQGDLVRAFADGRNEYKHLASRIATLRGEEIAPEDVADGSELYNLGKESVLGLGYGMGGPKFRASALKKYGIDLDELFAHDVVGLYRARYPRVPLLWRALEDAALRAVREPETVFAVRGLVRFTQRGGYLYLILPSGRPLSYPAPRVIDRELPWGGTAPAVEVEGVDSYTRQWVRYHVWGGHWTENAVQAMCRDLMAYAMRRAEGAGWPSVLTVHDSITSEVPAGWGTDDEFRALVTEIPSWAAGFPLAVKVKRGRRFA